MKTNKTTGSALAIAAAGMFAFAPTSIAGDAKEGKEVKCYGVNSCAGKNDCKTADNSCKGKSSCKGHGFLKMSKEACEKMEGKIKDDEV